MVRCRTCATTTERSQQSAILSTKTTQRLVPPATSTSRPLTATHALQIPNSIRSLVALVRLGDATVLLTSTKVSESATTQDRTTCRGRLTSYSPTTSMSTDFATSQKPWLVRLAPISESKSTDLPPITLEMSASTTTPTTRLSSMLRKIPTIRMLNNLRNVERTSQHPGQQPPEPRQQSTLLRSR